MKALGRLKTVFDLEVVFFLTFYMKWGWGSTETELICYNAAGIFACCEILQGKLPPWAKTQEKKWPRSTAPLPEWLVFLVLCNIVRCNGHLKKQDLLVLFWIAGHNLNTGRKSLSSLNPLKWPTAISKHLRATSWNLPGTRKVLSQVSHSARHFSIFV